ncbi:MAG: radical SAM protein [Campylobacteraceae bacterium]|jgi:DNA repair photolyase|nr:radical SAM protein [Campylobacteraceae bacterium]
MITIREISVKNLITKSKLPSVDFVINPYVGCPHKCIYCYAEFMKKFTNHKEKWGDFLDAKTRYEKIDIEKFKNHNIFLSSVTDAYNPFEKKYNITKQVLERFANSGANISILTKSNLVLRDIEIFKKIPNINVGFSINTTNDDIRKEIEPHASSIEKRIEALKILHGEGIDTWTFVSPIFPQITDFEKILELCKRFSNSFGFENLNLKNMCRERVLNYIQKRHKNLLPLYQEIYTCNDKSYWRKMSQEIHSYCQKNEIDYTIHFH